MTQEELDALDGVREAAVRAGLCLSAGEPWQEACVVIAEEIREEVDRRPPGPRHPRRSAFDKGLSNGTGRHLRAVPWLRR